MGKIGGKISSKKVPFWPVQGQKVSGLGYPRAPTRTDSESEIFIPWTHFLGHFFCYAQSKHILVIMKKLEYSLCNFLYEFERLRYKRKARSNGKKEINFLTPDGIKLHVETSQNYSTKVTHKQNMKVSSISTTAQGISGALFLLHCPSIKSGICSVISNRNSTESYTFKQALPINSLFMQNSFCWCFSFWKGLLTNFVLT